MTVTATSIKEMFPEFAGKSDSFVNIFIDAAKELICESMYGNRYCLALSYLTAHLMKVSSDSGKGDVSKEKVGDLAREYKTSSGSNCNSCGYGSTSYGQQFLAIRGSLINKKLRPICGSSC
jgi:hypothetical protein